MRKVLKWVGIVLAGLVGLLVVAALLLYAIGSARLSKKRDIQAEAITIPEDEVALARGEHLVKGVALCTVCHGEDLSGDIEIEDGLIGTVYASNITGLGATYSDADLVRAIRHGVDEEGRQLLLMPSDLFANLSAEDLGAIIAFLKTVPPAGNDRPAPRIAFVGRDLLAAGMFGDVFAAEKMDHNRPFPPMPSIGANVAYGDYLAPFCTTCHGPDLSGQRVDPTESDSPWAPNLTPGGDLQGWSQAAFIRAMRTGVTPEGHMLDSEWMPWQAFARLNDDELKGLWLYLQSLPARESGS